jgi:hypothetical protein
MKIRSMNFSAPSKGTVIACAISAISIARIALGIAEAKNVKPNEGDTFTTTIKETKQINDSTVTFDNVIPTKSGKIHMPITATPNKICYGMPTGQGEITYTLENPGTPSDTLRGKMVIETKSGNHVKYPFTYTATSGMKLDCVDLKELAKKAAKGL